MDDNKGNRNCRIDKWMTDILARVDSGKADLFIREGERVRNLYYDGIAEQVDKAYERIEEALAEKCGERVAEEIIFLVGEYADAVRDMHFSIGLETGAALYEKVRDSAKENS